ncbi:MAG: membrane protein insertase YidC [Planctomycetes bacterium]|nr:membrane protein insertase YidC [Planctomycetota bacterium]
MKKNTLLVFMVIFGLLAAVMTVVVYLRKPEPSLQHLPSVQPAVQQAPVVTGPQDMSVPAETVPPVIPETPESLITLENGIYSAVFSNKGASLKTLILKQFDKDEKKQGKLEILYQIEKGKNSFIFSDAYLKEQYAYADWSLFAKTADSVTYRYVDSEGLQIDKTFKFIPDRYGIEVTFDFRNLSQNILMRQLDICGPAGIFPEFDKRYLVSGYAGNFENGKWSVTEEPWSTLQEQITEGNEKEHDVNLTKWLGITNKYFAATLVPVEEQCFSFFKFDFVVDNEYAAILSQIYNKYGGRPSREQLKREFIAYKDAVKPNLSIKLRTQRLYFEATEKVTTFHLLSYAGPKRTDDLIAEPFGKYIHGEMLSYGWFGFISKILLAIMKAFFWLSGNYGVSIILLTLIVKVCMFPLTKKQYTAQYRMQDLSPKIKALKEKYKNDPKKAQVETFKIFKEHGVNPISGCLPLLMQLPIFIGLYQALYVSIDLRLAPFTMWITDLAQPDLFTELSFSIPILGTNKLHLLPLIMTVSWFIQSFLQPRSPDPEQAMQQKIFMFMPILFGFMFYSMPAGLVLYWLANTLFSIVEQQIIKRVFLPKT